jgi:hypothetical protein
MYRIRAKLYVKGFCAHLKTILDHRRCLPEFFYLLLGQINSHLKQYLVSSKNRQLEKQKYFHRYSTFFKKRRRAGMGWDTK